MSNSPLVEYVHKTVNYSPRGRSTIKKVTIHHAAGRISVEGMGYLFAKPERQGSANYGIGSDGRIALFVDEKNRAWTSGSPDNDYQAVTIEVSNCENKSPWRVSDDVYNQLIRLTADICKRNGIKKLYYTGDASGNLTIHKFFQKTACPGEYLESKMPEIADEVNYILKGNEPMTKTERKELDAVEARVEKKYNTVDDCPEWARDTVKRLSATGILAGDGSGFALTEDMLRLLVMIDRAGVFK